MAKNLGNQGSWQDTFLQIYQGLFPLYLGGYLNSTPSTSQIRAAIASAKQFPSISSQLQNYFGPDYANSLNYISQQLSQLAQSNPSSNPTPTSLGNNAFGVLMTFTYNPDQCPNGVMLPSPTWGAPLACIIAEFCSLIADAKAGTPQALSGWSTLFDLLSSWQQAYPGASKSFKFIVADLNKMTIPPNANQYQSYMNSLLADLKQVESTMGISPPVLAA